MVGWSNYVLDTGKKLSCPTGGRHATLHATENNPKMFGQSVSSSGQGRGSLSGAPSGELDANNVARLAFRTN